MASNRKNPVVGLVQHGTTGDKKANIDKAIRGIREAASRGASLVCLEELFASPYFCQVEDAGQGSGLPDDNSTTDKPPQP